MATQSQMTDEQFAQHAFGILGRELGADGLARFIRVYRAGTGDYTDDRHKWLDGVSVDDLLADARRLQEDGVIKPR